MKQIITVFIAVFIFGYSYAQVGIGTTSVDASAILELDDPNRALLLPRVANTAAIATPVNGMLIYDISGECIKAYENGAWTDCLGAGPTVITLDCAGATVTGTLTEGVAASGVSFDVDYTGGNGLPYSGEAVSSTGVTGLTATLAAGTLATGAGTVTYTVSGTPATSGTASFAISLGGQSCTVNLTVASTAVTIRIAHLDTYSIGSSQLLTYQTQLDNTANYGTSGTVNTVAGFTYTDIASTLATTSGAVLRANYDIISTGFAEITATESQNLEDFVDAGGVVFALLDNSIGDQIHQQFGGTGAIGNGLQQATTNSNTLNNNDFGTATNFTLLGSGSYGGITTSQLPSGATVLATNGGDPRVWLTGTGNRVIFIWDEGVFRNTSNITGTVIDTTQEIWVHNMMAYALEQLGY